MYSTFQRYILEEIEEVGEYICALLIPYFIENERWPTISDRGKGVGAYPGIYKIDDLDFQDLHNKVKTLLNDFELGIYQYTSNPNTKTWKDSHRLLTSEETTAFLSNKANWLWKPDTLYLIAAINRSELTPPVSRSINPHNLSDITYTVKADPATFSPEDSTLKVQQGPYMKRPYMMGHGWLRRMPLKGNPVKRYSRLQNYVLEEIEEVGEYSFIALIPYFREIDQGKDIGSYPENYVINTSEFQELHDQVKEIFNDFDLGIYEYEERASDKLLSPEETTSFLSNKANWIEKPSAKKAYWIRQKAGHKVEDYFKKTGYSAYWRNFWPRLA